MNRVYATYESIDGRQWKRLAETSSVATWWQTEEAYLLFASIPEYQMYVVSVVEDERLVGVCVIMQTNASNVLLRSFTRRAIVMGGLLIDDNISEAALRALLTAVADKTQDAVYTEIRNLHDYSRWREVFESVGWTYEPHLNVQVDTTNSHSAAARIGKHKQRRIGTSVRAGARVVENPTEKQAYDCYLLLRKLYTTRVRKPLPSWELFATLYRHEACRFVLVENEGKIIGGSVCVLWPGKAIYEWYACGRDDARRTVSPASLTKYAEIQMAGEQHIPLLDLMGAGTPDKPYGVRDFKAEFGGEIVEHGRWMLIHKQALYRLGKTGMHLLSLF